MKVNQKILMCKPDHFDVKYVINPWMQKGSVDKDAAMRQWNNLKNTLTSLGASVEIINQERGLPDMVFTADQIVTRKSNVLLGNFRFTERKNEVDSVGKWLASKNYNLACTPKNTYLEGGDCVKHDDKMLLGIGFRTSYETCKVLAGFLETEVHCLDLINPDFYHLDTCLFSLNNNVCFYYPQAFSKKSQKILKQQIRRLIQLTKKEAYQFAANSVVVGKNVIIQKGNKTFSAKLNRLGYKTYEVDVSEFIKAGGGVHCLVNYI